MSAFSNPPPRLITPPKEEEIFPYRRVWRSIIIESAILILLMLVIFVLWTFLGISTPAVIQTPVNLMLAVSPALLWLIFSRLPETFVPQPRRNLLTVFTVSALIANAIGIPIIDNIIQPDTWLPLQSLGNRIIGYMLTVGILHEFLKYAVVRYIAFPQYYRNRFDSIAYCVASAMGYSMVLNLNYVLTNLDVTADFLIFRVFTITSISIVGSTVWSYGLSETLFNDALSFLMPFMFVFAAALVGLAIPMGANFTNATLGLTDSAQNTIIGMGFSMAFYIGMMLVMWFFFDVAERRERDRFESDEA